MPSRRAMIAALLIALPARSIAAEPPLVAAAANLQPALDAIAAAFSARTGQSLRLVYGSTGTLATQIRNGAPFELFLAADEASVLGLRAEGRTVDNGAVYAIGRLVLFAHEGSAVVPDAELRGLAEALAGGAVRRIAIASPELAPYGRAAREVLEQAGLWGAAEPLLVRGESVAQAAQFALSGAADAGFLALAQVLAPRLAGRGRHALIPADRHAPLRQRMALLAPAGDTARAFHGFLRGAEARAILGGFGYEMPAGAD